MAIVTTATVAQGIARIAINRADKRNALNAEVRHGLIAAIGAALGDASVRALVLTGEGGHFCAGGDIGSMAELSAEAGRARIKDGQSFVKLLIEADKPVIAAIEGYAVGAGASLALLADTIVLAEGGTIGFPFFRIGLIPDMGLLYTLPRRVGLARARQMLIYARAYKGKDALALGLADEITPDGGAEARAVGLATELADMPAFPFALAKRHLAMAPIALDAALELEAVSQAACFTSADHAEGRAAFVEKRAPKFRR